MGEWFVLGALSAPKTNQISIQLHKFQDILLMGFRSFCELDGYFYPCQAGGSKWHSFDQSE